MSKQKQAITVARYLEEQLAVCGRSQAEIAAECGYENANIITLFKQGKTKVPISKAPVLAKAIGADPAFLLRLTLSEYLPDAWEALHTVFGQPAPTADEAAVLAFVREACKGRAIEISAPENRRDLAKALAKITERDAARARAAVGAHVALPRTARHKQ